MFKHILIFTVLSFMLLTAEEQPKTITFFSEDSLKITADLYMTNEDRSTPFIILFHQAGWSRGEYMETAPNLNALGFNCMAVDQRSGGSVNEIKNETARRAKAQGIGTDYLDAYPDMTAAIEFAKVNYADGKLIIWGSSYSAALVLHIAGQRKDIDAVMAFSPGEYFKKAGKPEDWIQSSAKNLQVPVFITSAKGEKSYWEEIYRAIPSNEKTTFLPKTEGNHGSRALWSKFDDSAAYWKAVKDFLKKL